ncbi:MAG: hypothetical protein GY953_49355, partial [bacterium]|nr:hypothetical protein [bacterium]
MITDLDQQADARRFEAGPQHNILTLTTQPYDTMAWWVAVRRRMAGPLPSGYALLEVANNGSILATGS